MVSAEKVLRLARDTAEFRVITLFHSVGRDFFAAAPGTALRGWRLANLKHTLFKRFTSLHRRRVFAEKVLRVARDTGEFRVSQFNLYDINGKHVASISLFHYFKNRLLNVSELPPGVYLAAVSCKGERVWSEKVLVQR